jgi:putative component of membrane protein insertase Oxa1/YidC/SpoIIIJ protein YidD
MRAWSIALISTAITLPFYALVKLLARFAPSDLPVRVPLREQDVVALLSARRHRSVPLVRWLMSTYRRSSWYAHLCRSGNPCRFIPNCNEYAERAVEKYGLRRGVWMLAGRVARCHPGYQIEYVDFP